MAKLSTRDGLKEKETRKEIVTRLKTKKAGGEKLTWKERCQLYWVKAVMGLVFGGWTIGGILLLLESKDIINIF